MSRLDIFGTYHIDNPRKVRAELEEFSSEAEIMFAESPKTTLDTSDWIVLGSRNPSVLVMALSLNALWMILGFVFTGEFDTVDSVEMHHVAERMGIEIEPVDLSILRQASDVQLLSTILSWIWFAIVVSVLIIGISLFSPTVVLGAFTLGFIPVVPFAYITLDDRNEVIADNIEQSLSNEELEVGCLVIGHKHIEGVVDKLEDSCVEIGEKHKPKFFRRSLWTN